MEIQLLRYKCCSYEGKSVAYPGRQNTWRYLRNTWSVTALKVVDSLPSQVLQFLLPERIGNASVTMFIQQGRISAGKLLQFGSALLQRRVTRLCSSSPECNNLVPVRESFPAKMLQFCSDSTLARAITALLCSAQDVSRKKCSSSASLPQKKVATTNLTLEIYWEGGA